jgi:serine/threonine-protein kinase
MGVIRTTNAIPGRRIYVDDRVVGQTPDSATIKCGPHQIKVGSSGKVQTIDVPCGGEISLGN